MTGFNRYYFVGAMGLIVFLFFLALNRIEKDLSINHISEKPCYWVKSCFREGTMTAKEHLAISPIGRKNCFICGRKIRMFPY